MSKFLQNISHKSEVGRPTNPEKTTAFEKMNNWLGRDSRCNLCTLNDLMLKMEELGGRNSSVYGEKSLLKIKLRDGEIQWRFTVPFSGLH